MLIYMQYAICNMQYAICNMQYAKDKWEMKIAIVDDSASVRLMISICLEEILDIAEDEVFEFVSGVDALDDFRDNFYDIVFCDMYMPTMSGAELVRKISNELPAFKETRIIMVTGEENYAYQKKLKKLGVHQFIKKPIRIEMFKKQILPFFHRAKSKKTRT